MKTAIYTANFGKYDKWHEPLYVDPSIDYYVFTDDVNLTSKHYQAIYINPADEPAYAARYYKIHEGYQIMCRKGYDLIIWHDSSMRQIADIKSLIDAQVTDMMLMKHPNRDCIYDEFHACCDAYPPKDNVKTMFDQVQFYADGGYPEKNGLVATGLIFRRNTDRVKRFSEDWWYEVNNGSKRDQLSFNYVAWIDKFKYDVLPFGDTLTYFFEIFKHKK